METCRRLRSRPRRRRRRRRRENYHLLLSGIICALLQNFSNISIHVEGEDRERGQLEFQSLCAEDWVHVSSLILTCDSPGAYYYGSTTYRNSEVCMSNDKASLRLYITVSNDYNGNNILVTVESGIYDQFVTVIDSVSLCKLGVSGSNAQWCPRSGDYIVKTYYKVPAIRDYNFHYTPDIRITFVDGSSSTTSSSSGGSYGYNLSSSSSGGSSYGNNLRVLGCVSSGAVALHQVADHKASMGIAALGIAVLVFSFVFGLMIFLSYLRKRRLEQDRDQNSTRRYNYFRTLPSGQVVPLPGHFHPPSSLQQQHQQTVPGIMTQTTSTDDEFGGDVSSPSYGRERQTPTRPII